MIKEEKMITGKCKARDLIRELTKAWIFQKLGIGPVWELDETDIETIGRN